MGAITGLGVRDKDWESHSQVTQMMAQEGAPVGGAAWGSHSRDCASSQCQLLTYYAQDFETCTGQLRSYKESPHGAHRQGRENANDSRRKETYRQLCNNSGFLAMCRFQFPTLSLTAFVSGPVPKSVTSLSKKWAQ